jgi:thioredoxin 1
MGNFVKSLFGKKEDEVETVVVTDEVIVEAVTEASAPAEEATAGPIHVSDDTFEELVLHSHLPVMVDFWAPWCGPCRMIAPIVEDLAVKYQGQAVVAKINTDENPEVPASLGIMGIPTVILFQDGEEVDRVVGFAPGHALENKLKALMG